jgi:preprotein translocase subunit YajC
MFVNARPDLRDLLLPSLPPDAAPEEADQKMLDELQNGNVVTTSGGIVGSIVSMGDDETLVLRVKPDNIKIQVARSAVASLVSKESK